jgi:ribosomal silencing factor RsfS
MEEIFMQEMGKIYGKWIKKQIKIFGINNCWFGIIYNFIVASGVSKDQVEEIVKQIVPEVKQNYVYYFKI